MAVVQLAAHQPSDSGSGPTQTINAMRTSSGHQDNKRRRLQKATPACYFDARFSPGHQMIIGDSSIIGVQSCLETEERRAPINDDLLTGGCNHLENRDTMRDASPSSSSSPQPRMGALALPRLHSTPREGHVQFLQPPASNPADDSIIIYSTHSSISPLSSRMDAESRRRSKTPVFFIGQLERKSVGCELDKAQLLASEYQAVLPLRLKTSFALSQSSLYNQYPDMSSCRPNAPKRLRKIKCQLSLRDLVKQQSQGGFSPSTPGSDAETLVGSPQCSPFDEDFDKKAPNRRYLVSLDHDSQTQPHESSSDEDDGLSVQALTTDVHENDIGLKICTELLTNVLASALLRHHRPLTLETEIETKDRASGLQTLLMIEAYETVQSQVRRMLYDERVTGKQFGHVREADRILEHWLMTLYAVYDREQEQDREEKRRRVDYMKNLG